MITRRRSSPGYAARIAALLAVTSAAGCTKALSDSEADSPSMSGSGGSSSSSSCGPTADPIRRLTPEEYVNSVATFFPNVTLPSDRPISDARVRGFTNQSAGQSISDLGVRKYEELARTIGTAASTQLDSWAPCTEDSVECIQTIGTQLAFRTYRRPLTDEETSHVENFASSVHEQFGMEEGVALVVQGLLESPWFIFRPEFGRPGDGASTPLDDYEMATRLSYFFLSKPPDDELLDAASRGELGTEAEIEAHAVRLMAAPEAREVLTNFFAEWLGLYRLDNLSLDPGTFPEFDTAMREDLVRSARLYIDKALWEDDSLDQFFTGSYAFVNDRLAPLYGVEAPGSEELVLREVDPAQRSGILTQPALLAATSHGISHSPILRGVALLGGILCSAPPSPPAGILDNLEPLEVPEEEVCTVRDRVAKTHTVREGCATCHDAIDAAGFAFENYDALGRYRTEENGCDVDATSVLPGALGEVNGAVELSARLADSPEVAECLTKQTLRFALGRADTRNDSCEIDRVAEVLKDGRKSLQSLVLELVLSAPFRTRLVSAE